MEFAGKEYIYLSKLKKEKVKKIRKSEEDNKEEAPGIKKEEKEDKKEDKKEDEKEEDEKKVEKEEEKEDDDLNLEEDENLEGEISKKLEKYSGKKKKNIVNYPKIQMALIYLMMQDYLFVLVILIEI